MLDLIEALEDMLADCPRDEAIVLRDEYPCEANVTENAALPSVVAVCLYDDFASQAIQENS